MSSVRLLAEPAVRILARGGIKPYLALNLLDQAECRLLIGQAIVADGRGRQAEKALDETIVETASSSCSQKAEHSR